MNVRCFDCGRPVDLSYFSGNRSRSSDPGNRVRTAVGRCHCNKNYLVTVEALDNEIRETIRETIDP